jgi:hypothetical protein
VNTTNTLREPVRTTATGLYDARTPGGHHTIEDATLPSRETTELR